MQQPARNREAGQRLTRDDLSVASGLSRMAEAGALATAASAMALGTLNAQERPADGRDAPQARLVAPQPGAAENGHGRDAAATDAHPRQQVQAPSGEAVRLPDDTQQAAHAGASDTVWDPSALTARIAEQIASSVSHVLDIASGGGGTPQTLSRDIVERAQHIAEEVHGQFAVREPLAVLADLVPHTVDTLGEDIVHSVGEALAQSGVMDLLNGVASVVEPENIVDGIVADLQGLKLPVDVGALVSEPLDAVVDVAGSLLGGADQGENPLADLFYDDGGADAALSKLGDVTDSVAGLVAEIPKIGFLGQPLDAGEDLPGLTHGSNALQVL